jgi:hypothetical protein
VRGAQLRPRLGPAALAAQPLAVQQVRAGEFGPKAGAAEPVGRLAVPALGVLAVAEQRAAACVDPCPQSVWPMLVASASRASAPAASRLCPVLLAASISSGSARIETCSSGACSAACCAWARAVS